MISEKKYIILLIAIVSLFMLGNLILWHGFVKQTFSSGEHHGDMARMGSYAMNKPAIGLFPYKKHHLEMADYIKNGASRQVDVLTIGDSYFNGHSGNYFQDYLTEKYGLNVLNVPSKFQLNALEMLYLLDDLGYLAEIKPRVVVLESVERNIYDRFVAKEVYVPRLTREQFAASFKPAGESFEDKAVRQLFPAIMFKANGQYLKNRHYAWKHKKSASSSVGRIELTKNLFSNKGQENVLIYYKDDMQYLKRPKLDAALINKKMETAAAFLKKYNSRLVFMVMVDKFDLYQPFFTKEDAVDENTFFTDFQAVKGNSYDFCDTKAVLQQAAFRGETDLCWGDDSHFSWKGDQLVGDELVKFLK